MKRALSDFSRCSALLVLPILLTIVGCGTDDSAGDGSSGSGGSGGSGTATTSSAQGGAQSTSSANGGGGAASTSAGTGGASSYGETPCVQCELGACSTQLSACDANAECKAFVDCLLACPAKNSHEVDSACADTCVQPASADGSALTSAFFMCVKAVDGQDGDPPGVACEQPCA